MATRAPLGIGSRAKTPRPLFVVCRISRRGLCEEIRHTTNKGRGVFALEPIPRGARVAICSGQLLHTDELQPHHFTMQVGGDLWLCSDGEQVDDCFNHSCEPKVGFVTGEPVLYALREIQPGEEICWDYSTSLSEPGWCLEC